MSGAVTRHDLDRFRAAIAGAIGLHFDDAKLGFLDEVLCRRLERRGGAVEPYLRELEQGASGEFAALAPDLTVGETYFFRNREQFRALAEAVLPQRMRCAPPSQTLSLLVAGCASGEEAYTLAIVAREALDPSWKVAIRAVDLNPAALQKAARGRYSAWALRDTPPEIRRRWFRPDGRDLVLDEALRAAVTFEARNIAAADPELWPANAYDAVFCRNVLMYFSAAQMRAAVARIAQSLAPGGFLFLGHAETLRGVSDAFDLHHTHDTFYYERREGPARSEAPRPAARAGIAGTRQVEAAWFDAIGAASARVAALCAAPPALPVANLTAAAMAAAAAPAERPDLVPTLDLLHRERFADALDTMRTVSEAAGRDPNALLLEATLLAQNGEFAAAEDACLRLLLLDETNAGAHYVLALCREHSGACERARAHDRLAVALDPDFAMPHLHLGLLARRAGDRNVARHELASALDLLRRENASRLALFGGGFNREALIALSEAALRECGGTP